MKNNENKKKAIRGIIFYVIFITILAFVSPVLGGSPSKPGLGFVIWGTAPLLVAAIICILTKDWCSIGLKPAFRKNALWYIFSIIFFPLVTVLTFLIGEMISVSTFSGFSTGVFLKTFLTALPVFLIFAVFEEIGWRGYLVPKLCSTGINSYIAYAVTAMIWATWHLPYFRELSWVYSSEELITFIPRFYLAMFAFTILYGEIRLITGSVWPAVIMHGVMNSFGHPLSADYLTIVPGREYLVSTTGLFMIVFAGGLGIALNRWRLRKR